VSIWDPPAYDLLCSWDCRHEPPFPAYWLWCLPRPASNYNPPNLCLSSNWDYRCEPLHLAFFFFFWQGLIM
jgi:hypothetical protein